MKTIPYIAVRFVGGRSTPAKPAAAYDPLAQEPHSGVHSFQGELNGDVNEPEPDLKSVVLDAALPMFNPFANAVGRDQEAIKNGIKTLRSKEYKPQLFEIPEKMRGAFSCSSSSVLEMMKPFHER